MNEKDVIDEVNKVEEEGKSFIQKVKDYYPTYISAHQNTWNRRLHLFGEVLTLFYFLSCVFEHFWLALPLAPFIIYPWAWLGHLAFEKNKPATWTTNPLITKVCDVIMCGQMVIGKIEF